MKKIYFLLVIPFFSFYLSSAYVPQLWGMSSSGGSPDSGGTIIKINLDGSAFGKMYVFDTLSGITPNGSLIEAPNGALYGMTKDGGLYGGGVIFEYDYMNNIYINDFDFDYFITGGNPESNFLKADNGIYYAMTSGGGTNGRGTLFSFEPIINNFTHLYDLSDSVGSYPLGYLLQVDDKLYGLTSEGGTDTTGTLFSYNITDNTFSVLHNFTKATGNSPTGSLVKADNGLLYGMTSNGGLYDDGVLFSFNLADSVYAAIFNFNDTLGKTPFGSLINTNEGLLYGMTSAGGPDNAGVIFSFDPDLNAYTGLFEFDNTNGKSPRGELIQASNGMLYGMTRFGGANGAGVIFSFDQTAQSYGVLLDFNRANGQYPSSDLIEIFTTGIAENSAIGNITLYPNPAKNEIRIKNPALGGTGSGLIIEKFEIYNIPGEIVYTQFQTSKLKPETDIDISSLSPGVYFIRMYGKQNEWSGKFVKE